MAGRIWISVALTLLLGASAPAWPEATGSLPLKWIADIPLEGRPTRFDYQSYDPGLHRLFIAHLGDSALTVVDTQSQQVVANIPGIAQVHGVLAIPELGRVYASATGAHQVVAIDTEHFEIIATIPGGTSPDGLAYAAPMHKLYVSDKAGSLVVIDVRSNRQIGAITLGGEVGNSQYDPVTRRVLVNVEGRSELVAIDPETDSVAGRYPLPGAEGNHGLLVAPDLHRAFIACEGNARLLEVDLRTMEVVSAQPVGQAPDVLAFDPELAVLYVASESGVLSMFKVADGRLRKIGEAPVAPRAHSIAVAPDTHRVYLPLENVSNHPVLKVMEPVL